ncbi:MAG: cell wall-binding repeat-containing protein [Oscillospiraceae bacterium]|nr:cell wall-binding repeat-containing protein [Oscillospiraceae bacterium]
MKLSIAKAMRAALSMLLVLTMLVGLCPAAFAAETDDTLLGYDEAEITERLMTFLQDFWPKVDENVQQNDPVEYVAKEDSFYVALGDSSVSGEAAYPALLAEELDIPYENLSSESLKFADELYGIIEKNADTIAKADLISVGFSAHVFLNNAIEYALYSFGAPSGGNPLDLDWVELLGEEYAEDVQLLLDELKARLLEQDLGEKPADIMVNCVEACAYSVTNYAVHLPEILATLREYNPDATIVVVGMYDATGIVSTQLEGSDEDLSQYMDMIMEAAEDHASDCCSTIQNAAYVSAKNAETLGEYDGDEVILNMNNPTDGILYNANIVRNKLIPSENGHTYMKNRILQAIVPIFRVAGDNRFATSFLVADQLKASLDVKKFDTIIVASGASFADALSGSYLSTVKGAPILLSFTTDEVNDQVVEYVKENLAEGGMIYILGGTSAVPESLDAKLGKYGEVKRLAGGNRFETNLMVLKEAGVGDKEILVCTGVDYADSLAASATGLPILLVYKELYETQMEYLTSLNGQNALCVIGGTSAVSQKLEDALDAYGTTNRVFGTNRITTSVKIAEEFFHNTQKMVVATGWQFADGLCGGALAYSMGAPLMLTLERFEDPIAAYAEDNRIDEGVILGGQNAVSDAAADASFGK